MKIAIDARFYGSGHTGLGRYTTNVLKYLPNYLQGQTLKVLLRDSEYDNFPGGKNIQKIRAEFPHYSFAEQLELPRLLSATRADLLYTFHFNVPIFTKIPTVVTVHDLIKSHFTGADTTTRQPWLYSLKRAGYNMVVKHALTRAKGIIVPTNTVKNDILALYPTVKPELIHAIPEAPDSVFRHPSTINHQPLTLPNKYILFVGNAYPHKNLPVLLQAMKQFPEYKLVIVAKESSFLSKLLRDHDKNQIIVYSGVNDQELKAIYQNALALVTPSLMEGYGLVGLEALMVATPVIASNIPVYREVYGDNVTYFDPHSVASLVSAINTLTINHRPSAINFKRTWDDVAEDIAEVINACCSRL